RPRGLRPNSHRAEERADQAVHGAALDRGTHAPLHRRRDRAHRRFRDARQRAHRDHRRTPAAHGDAEAAGRRVVRRAGHGRAVGDDRRSLRRSHARRYRPQRGPLALRPVTTMSVPSWFRGGAPRVLRCASGARIVVAVAALTACGKKGPPLAPLRLVPGPVADVTARRVGPDVQLRFRLPTANANGPGRIDLDHVEVYAVTVAPGSVTPPTRDLLTKTYLVGTVSGKRVPVEG